MKECCDKWLMSLFPRQPKDGRFKEKHRCPKCGKEYIVLFECFALMGGEFTCSALGVE